MGRKGVNRCEGTSPLPMARVLDVPPCIPGHVATFPFEVAPVSVEDYYSFFYIYIY